MNKKIRKKTLIVSIILIIGVSYQIISFTRYGNINEELNMLGYHQYDNKYIILPQTLSEMLSLLEDSLPPKGNIFNRSSDVLFPVNYDLLGANLEKNYRNEKLSVEDKWYIMFQDYNNLNKVVGDSCYDMGEYTYSEDENFYTSLICTTNEEKYSISMEINESSSTTIVGLGEEEYLETPSTTIVGLGEGEYYFSILINNLKDQELISVDYFNGDYEISPHKDQAYTEEMMEKEAEKFMDFTDKVYEEYLKVINK